MQSTVYDAVKLDKDTICLGMMRGMQRLRFTEDALNYIRLEIEDSVPAMQDSSCFYIEIIKPPDLVAVADSLSESISIYNFSTNQIIKKIRPKVGIISEPMCLMALARSKKLRAHYLLFRDNRCMSLVDLSH